MGEKLVSVLMTSYNREAYIAEAIQSILASTWTNFELNIVDDCSTDNTLEIARSFEKIDNRVKVFKNSKNLGQFENRNFAASLAKGEYIKYLDSDDIIYPHSLEIMMAAMLNFPEAGIGICEKYRDADQPYPYRLSSNEALRRHYLEHELLMNGPSGIILKKIAFDKVKGFENYGMPSDNHLTLKIAASFPVVILQRDLFWWRKHSDQAFQQQVHDEQNILNNFRFNEDILDNYSALDKKINKKIRSNLSKIFFKNIARTVVKKQKPLTAIRLTADYFKLTNHEGKS